MISPTFVYKATLLSVYDGDTMTVMADLGFHVQIALKLRLLGIDAPEIGTPCGKPARDFLRALAMPPLVIKTYKDAGDKYGRWLAEVYSDGRLINDYMIEAGHAVAYDGGKKA